MFMTQGVGLEDVAYMINMARMGRWKRGQRFGITRPMFSQWAQERGFTNIWQQNIGARRGGGVTAALNPLGYSFPTILGRAIRWRRWTDDGDLARCYEQYPGHLLAAALCSP